MKNRIILLISLFSAAFSFGQTPAGIQWQKCFGGSLDEYITNIQQTSDGGYISIGVTNSNNGDVSGNHGGTDVWLVKTNSIGNLQWQKCFGGTLDDYGFSIQQTTDGGFILTGYTYSNNGDVSGNHGNADVWVAKLNTAGILQWQKCFGGLSSEAGTSIQQTSDGGYVLVGFTFSNNGDVSGNHGEGDIWVVKLNSSGILQWQKCYGGVSYDECSDIKQTSDGGFILTGRTTSNDGDVSGNHGGSSPNNPPTYAASDYWVIKLNSSGVILWQKCFGGTSDEYSGSVQQTSDGGFILTGYTYSNNGDVSGNHGGADIWVAKLNTAGVLQWQKCFGGTSDDWGSSIKQTNDGGFILTGRTYSNNGDVSGNHGNADVWVAKLNTAGILQWQKCFGGNQGDYGNSIQQTSDGGFILGGASTSNNGNVSGNHGNEDFWIFKLFECNATTNSFSTLNVSSCTTYTTPLGQVLTSSGTITEVIPNHLGCDSTITINFTKYDAVYNSPTLYTCSLPYSWNGQSCPTYGVYTQVLQTVNGCDSTVNLTISYFPQVQDVCIVGNEPVTGKNKVVWEKELTQVVGVYNVYRENSQTGSYDLIGTTNYADSSVFLDLIANPNQQAYRYQIKYVDTCGIESAAGSTHKTIHLTINQGIGTAWNLIWTGYEGITYPSYNIYRGTNASNMALLTTVASNLTSYTDASAPAGLVYYQIEIVSPTNCNPTKSAYNNSKSNVSTNDPNYLGIDQYALNSILIFPNPANSQINIEYSGQIQNIEILDAKGAKVYSSSENKKVYALPTTIQTGYYMLIMYTYEGVFRKELMIEN